MRMVVSVGWAVKEAFAIPAVSTVARMQSLIPDDALHPMEHRFGTPGRVTAAAHGLFNPIQPHGPRLCFGK